MVCVDVLYCTLITDIIALEAKLITENVSQQPLVGTGRDSVDTLKVSDITLNIFVPPLQWFCDYCTLLLHN